MYIQCGEIIKEKPLVSVKYKSERLGYRLVTGDMFGADEFVKDK